jgi:hypothetical protein
MSWYMLNGEAIFFENDSLIPKHMRNKIEAIEAPDKVGGAWKTKTGKRRAAPQKLKTLEEE